VRRRQLWISVQCGAGVKFFAQHLYLTLQSRLPLPTCTSAAAFVIPTMGLLNRCLTCFPLFTMSFSFCSVVLSLSQSEVLEEPNWHSFQAYSSSVIPIMTLAKCLVGRRISFNLCAWFSLGLSYCISAVTS
jgi:hypothetical protein